jgi:hypothetical protein
MLLLINSIVVILALKFLQLFKKLQFFVIFVAEIESLIMSWRIYWATI